MSGNESSKFGRFRAFCASFLVLIGMMIGVSSITVSQEAFAIESGETAEETTEEDNEDETTDENATNEEDATDEDADTEEEGETEEKEKKKSLTGDTCKDSLGAIGWFVCPSTGKIAEAVDWLYDKIEEVLVINPVPAEDGSPIYEVWKYFRGLTNIVFIIFLLVVIYAQLTGVGISNYGIKKILPKLIIAVIMVNLSFLICSLLVDISNIVGEGLRGMFESVEESALASSSVDKDFEVSYVDIYGALTAGTGLAIVGGTIAFEAGVIWMLIPLALGALVAVVTGLVTVALRQAVVVLLIMISPLAVVSNILPNTEKWFIKWKDLFLKMIIFYPMFSLLFGASSLAGFAIILSAKDGFGLLLGVAVQIIPLFFAWSLMKMSGTFLNDVNARLNGLAERPLAANREWADSHRRQSRARNIQYGKTPYSRLQRFLDNRKALREQDTANLEQARKNDANVYVQKVIGAGYDGTKAKSTEADLTPNKYTKAAKDLANSTLMSERATMDTAHAIGNYGNYYVSKSLRKKVDAARAAGDETLASKLEATNDESRRAAAGANAWLEYNRAAWTKEHDTEADIKFAADTFINSAANYNPGKVKTAEDKEKMEKYQHYIVSSAGGLGEIGQTRVLGKVLAQAASVENAQRRDVNIVAQKWPPDKGNFRNMAMGYLVNDDGFAVDREGKVIEKERGYLLKHDPDKLITWDKIDANGPYYDWYDTNGKFVTRVYKSDKSTVKELMSNFDIPINDPINNLYGIMAGIKEGDIKGKNTDLKYIGLDGYRTTIGRALLGAPFKEKNAAFSPLVKEMVSRGYIQNSAQQYLAYLDSVSKATKPGAWNVQDRDAISMFALIMDPKNWKSIFPLDLIKDYKNVNGEEIYGYQLDANGNIVLDSDGEEVKVPKDQATWDELMARIKKKYITPALKKMPMMMKHMTPNMIENQKPETAKAWKSFVEAIEACGQELGVDPYDSTENGDMEDIVKGIRRNFKKTKGNGGDNSQQGKYGVNHQSEARDIYYQALDGMDFAKRFDEYCAMHKELEWVAREFRDYVISAGSGASKDDLYEYAQSLLDYVEYD